VWSCSYDMSIMVWDSQTRHFVGEIHGYHTDAVSVLVACELPDRAVPTMWSGSFDTVRVSHLHNLRLSSQEALPSLSPVALCLVRSSNFDRRAGHVTAPSPEWEGAGLLIDISCKSTRASSFVLVFFPTSLVPCVSNL
jgi:hypothetical protein